MDRVPLWDNARFVVIALVVVGHGVQRQTADSDAAYAIYLAIYSFHMPLMLLLAGWFSRAQLDGERMRRIVGDLIVPYLVFQTIWSLVQWAVEGNRPFDYSAPKWTLWFLVALAIMRLLLPFLALLRPWVLWPLAVAVAIAVGYWPGVDSTFALSRTLGMLPFFLLGWQLARTPLSAWWLAAEPRTTVPARVAATLVVAGALAAGLAFADAFRGMGLQRWFFLDDPYRALDAPGWWAGLVRLGLMAVTLVVCAAVMALVPRRETWFTAFGQATMYVYLLHSFVLYPLRESGVLRGAGSEPLWVAAVVVGALLLAVVLSTRPVQRLFRPLVQPRSSWIFRPSA